MNFLLSTLALLAGPLVYAVGRRYSVMRQIFDATVFATIAWIIGVHIIPEALSVGGMPALLFLLLGIAFPVVLKRVFHIASRAAHIALTTVAAVGLGLHAMVDGIALMPEGDERLALAVMLHRIPVGMAIWWTFRPALGNTTAIAAFVLIIASTGLAFYFGPPVAEMAESRSLAMFQAFVSGTLIDLVAIGILQKLILRSGSAQ